MGDADVDIFEGDGIESFVVTEFDDIGTDDGVDLPPPLQPQQHQQPQQPQQAQQFQQPQQTQQPQQPQQPHQPQQHQQAQQFQQPQQRQQPQAPHAAASAQAACAKAEEEDSVDVVACEPTRPDYTIQIDVSAQGESYWESSSRAHGDDVGDGDDDDDSQPPTDREQLSDEEMMRPEEEAARPEDCVDMQAAEATPEYIVDISAIAPQAGGDDDDDDDDCYFYDGGDGLDCSDDFSVEFYDAATDAAQRATIVEISRMSFTDDDQSRSSDAGSSLADDGRSRSSAGSSAPATSSQLARAAPAAPRPALGINTRRWLTALARGRNVLLYGIGSKTAAGDALMAESAVRSVYRVRVSGTRPRIVREMLKAIGKFLDVWGSDSDVLKAAEAAYGPVVPDKCGCAPKLLLFVDDIDGPGFEKEEQLQVLARLARLARVRVCATVDNIIAPLWWTPSQRSAFSWAWMEASTWKPYSEAERSKVPPPPQEAEEGTTRSRAARAASERLAQLSDAQQRLLRILMQAFAPAVPATAQTPRKRETKAGGTGTPLAPRAQKRVALAMTLAQVDAECKKAGVMYGSRRVEETVADLVREGFLREGVHAGGSTERTWHLAPPALLLVQDTEAKIN
eukprot:m51a1_g5386 Origin recognition complex, subunit 2 (623) ;mRNA; f:16115-18119